ncbi:MAG: hypothetical protein U0360_01930 [Dehalococcoidia bacterium]
MASWTTFAAGGAEVLHVQAHGERGRWQPFQRGAEALATAGQRLLAHPPAGIALLATVSRTGAPRLHPFMPRIVEGALVAFIVGDSPKLRDLLAGRPCAIHSAPTIEDEEFWVRAFASALTDPARVAAASSAMPWAKPEFEVLVEFDLFEVGWTQWLDFGTPRHRPVHHRWRQR